AISVVPDGRWILVTGDTVSSNFPSFANHSSHVAISPQPFIVAMQPCRTGMLYSRAYSENDGNIAPPVALTPALDAFSSPFTSAFASAGVSQHTYPLASVSIGPDCSSATP